MLSYAPGTTRLVSDVETGGCILLTVGNSARVCFVVELRPSHRYVLDPLNTARGAEMPAAYPIDRHFRDVPCIYFPEARLRPSLLPAHVAKGIYGQGGISRILYLAAGGYVIQAAMGEHSLEDFNLMDGQT